MRSARDARFGWAVTAFLGATQGSAVVASFAARSSGGHPIASAVLAVIAILMLLAAGVAIGGVIVLNEKIRAEDVPEEPS